ncbi:GlxA family transcriptional regulator [Streptomyces iranensis]|uniref:GlxA family transcriptional regulator n=1 Tax=Streptomyces iranensis TaxID=576784 RepID=UPI0039B72EF4
MEVMIAQQIFGFGVHSARTMAESGMPYEITLCGEKEGHRSLSSGVELTGLASLDALLTADTVIVPGVREPLTARSDLLLSYLGEAHAAGKRMVSFCGGAFVFGQAGILDGRRATTHWLYAEDFRRNFPDVMLEPEHLYVDDGRVHTSGGIFSAADLALHLIALDMGQAYANDVGRILVTAPHRSGGQSQFFKESLRIKEKTSLGPLLDWLRIHLHEPLTLSQLADHEHTSERSLLRRFREDTGMSVFAWINQERVNRAKVLLETTDHRTTDIAAMVGFGSAETLRRNFRKNVGVTTVNYRAQYRAENTGTRQDVVPRRR